MTVVLVLMDGSPLGFALTSAARDMRGAPRTIGGVFNLIESTYNTRSAVNRLRSGDRCSISEPATQRADSLAPLAGLLDDFGVSLDDVLDGTGLSRSDILPDRFIPYDAYLEILQRAVDRTGREDFGLLLGSRQTLATVGPLAQAVRSSATLGEALADFTAFQIINSTGAATYLHRRDDWVFLGYGTHDPSLTVSPYVHDIVLAVGSMMLRELTGGAVRAAEYTTMRWKPADRVCGIASAQECVSAKRRPDATSRPGTCRSLLRLPIAALGTRRCASWPR